MRLLVVEDDEKIASFVIKGLKQAGFAVDRASDGEGGLRHLLGGAYDAAVVDIMLPFRDGLSVVQAARLGGVATPIIFLSARREVDDRIRGLQAGADDYLVKPFAFSELLARLKAIIRRASGVTDPVRLVAGDLEVDVIRRRVTRAGKEIALQPRELALLEYLMRHQGAVVSKVSLMEHVWDYSFDPETSVVETAVSRLRAKLGDARSGESELIQTVRGIGYVLTPRPH
jgi:two-component system OmpR family response regulator